MKNIKVTFAAKAVLIDFMSLIYREAFIDSYREVPTLMDGWHRVVYNSDSLFVTYEVEAPIESWHALFAFLSKKQASYFMSKPAMLVYSCYNRVKGYPEFADIKIINPMDKKYDVFGAIAMMFEECNNNIAAISPE